jgi:hypothetical protein
MNDGAARVGFKLALFPQANHQDKKRKAGTLTLR